MATTSRSTKADRTAAAKKAAATRERNQKRAASKVQGKKAASTRQQHEAQDALSQARRTVDRAFNGVFSATGKAVSLAGSAAVLAGKSIATRVGVLQEQTRH
jgi:hypothetical protein